MGRENEWGPRRLSKDMVINVRMQSAPSSSSSSGKIRGVLKKKESPPPYQGHYRETSAPPSLPPKVPIYQQQQPQTQLQRYTGGEDQEALSREISRIDIGSGRGGTRGSAVFVPVKSHRDRNNFY
jgi:hypothetical protein